MDPVLGFSAYRGCSECDTFVTGPYYLAGQAQSETVATKRVGSSLFSAFTEVVTLAASRDVWVLRRRGEME